MSKQLFLWLEGPLQSWGDRSRFGRRATQDYPTKSGVLGLLFCAMGLGGSREEELAELSKGKMTVYRFSSVEKEAPQLTAFHMVGSAYDVSDPWENLLVPKTSDGKKPVGAGTKLTYRDYLQDKAFAVFLEVPDSWCDRLEKGLTQPVWDIYLGRKCNVPTKPVFGGFVENEIERQDRLRARVDEESGLKLLDCLTEVSGSDPEGFVLQDVPLSFGAEKRYVERYVKVIEAIL